MLRVVPLAALLVVVTWGSPAQAQAPIPADTHCRSGRVALTFDDGPHPTHTPRLLELLRRHDARATFFVQGRNATGQRGLLRRMASDGHAVENHSWDHPDLTGLSRARITRQLRRTTTVIEQATGHRPDLFRPPYGDTSRRVRKTGARLGLEQELWTIDSRDWTGLPRAKIARKVLRGLRRHRSNVVLLHDAVTNSGSTVAAVPRIVAGIRHRGYCLVALQTMIPPARIGGDDLAIEEPAVGTRRVTVVLTLDRPSATDGSVRVSSDSGLDQRLQVPRGAGAVAFSVPVSSDPAHRPGRAIEVDLSQARGVQVDPRRDHVTIDLTAPHQPLVADGVLAGLTALIPTDRTSS